jgi:hypothetical protein
MISLLLTRLNAAVEEVTSNSGTATWMHVRTTTNNSSVLTVSWSTINTIIKEFPLRKNLKKENKNGRL